MKRFNFIKSEKGQSSVEAAVISIVLVTFVSIFFVTLYVIYASYWVEHILYESLICYQERGHKNFCIEQAKDRINSTLAFSNSFEMKMEPRGSITRAKIQMKINPPILKEKIFIFTKELKI